MPWRANRRTTPTIISCSTSSNRPSRRRWLVFDEARVHNRNSDFDHQGDRHAAAARALSQHPDAYIGWLSLDDASFSVKRRSPYKKDFPTDKIDGFSAYRNLTRQWGRILAREHLRGAAYLEPDSPARFAGAIADRIGNERETFKRLIVEFAETYAERTRRDYDDVHGRTRDPPKTESGAAAHTSTARRAPGATTRPANAATCATAGAWPSGPAGQSSTNPPMPHWMPNAAPAPHMLSKATARPISRGDSTWAMRP